MISVAQCKTNFDTAQTNAANKANTAVAWGGGADLAIAWASIAATWSFLYIERSRFAKQGFTPSAAAVTYADKAEAALNTAQSKMGSEMVVAQAFANIASNAAYQFAEQVRIDHTTP